MKIFKYFLEFIFIVILFIIFKILGFKLASNMGGYIGKKIGPLFRSKQTILTNIKNALPSTNKADLELIIQSMWENYGRILAEYVFLKDFRKEKLNDYLEIEGKEHLNKVRDSNEQVVFVSGHFNNFELMAMQIEKSGINLAAIYRPLNNIFLNGIMEKIRTKYICKNQIKKGRRGTRELLKSFNNKNSIALMIDQRVSEGEKSNFFGQDAFTTTIPAQLVKKFGCKIVPIHIERYNNFYFKMKVEEPINYNKDSTIDEITLSLNKLLENMILKNPSQWIWSHDRWK
tara:strand:- start:1780 stop:2640 length:861 start_codon:yes stop_codon:yes gene_type:complete